MVMGFLPLTVALDPKRGNAIRDVPNFVIPDLGADQVKGGHGDIANYLCAELAHPHIQFTKDST